MAIQYTPHALPLIFSAGIALVGAAVAWRRRRGSLEVWGTIVQLAVAAWALLVLATVTVTAESLKTVGITLLYPLAVAANIFFLVFTVHFVGRSALLTRRRLALLLSFPMLFLLAGVTNGLGFHSQLFDVAGTYEARGFVALDYAFGPLFYLLVVPAYGISLVYLGLLVQQYRRSRNVYRTMSALLFVCLATLAAVTVISLAGYSPFPHFMLFPYTYLVLGVILVLGTSSATFLRILPVEEVVALMHPHASGTIPTARDVIVQEIDDGIIVFDSDDIVVDSNATAKELLATDRPIGEPVSTALAVETENGQSLADVLFPDGTVSERVTECWIEHDGERRCYDIRISELASADEPAAGHVALVRDITERKRREQMLREREQALKAQKEQLETKTVQLEHQNERLDRFAGIVSHDLRNPLNVAYGRTSLIAAELEQLEEPPVDTEHLEITERSLQRMEEIIEDALTLARQGRALTETEPVSLARTVRQGWQNVDTQDATLEADISMTVESAENRLFNLFENLFRNAVEHGGMDVTVRVGPLENGFYVEDNGPGIPEENKESVLEEGVSTAEDGTGFGLAIVNNIVRAHGWSLTVADADSGGARFEITGVTVVETPETPS